MLQTLGLAAIGIVIGTGVSWAMVQGTRSLLFGVTPRDPNTFAGMVLMLITVALLAGYLPARRASRIDPMVALRAE
jgi:ABC-type antimicrobial peptide transport system permease subunit